VVAVAIEVPPDAPYDFSGWDYLQLRRSAKGLLDEFMVGRLPEEVLHIIERDLGHLVFEIWYRERKLNQLPQPQAYQSYNAV
jgi:hypothetical protein